MVPKRRSKYRVQQEEGTVEECTSEADLQTLAEEMTNWRDNMAGTALEQTQKFSTVEEAANQLEELVSRLEGVDVPDDCLALKVSWSELTPRSKRRSISRATRAANIGNQLEAAASALNSWALPGPNISEEEVEQAEEAATELEEIAGELGSIEFPGMFG